MTNLSCFAHPKVWNKISCKGGKGNQTQSSVLQKQSQSNSALQKKRQAKSSSLGKFGAKPHVHVNTTSFVEKQLAEDKGALLDLDTDMFDDDDSIREGKHPGENDHPALYYTMTLNWQQTD